MNEEIPNEPGALSSEMRSLVERSKNSLRVPDGYFEAQAAMLESSLMTSFKTPDQFFNLQAEALEQLYMRDRVDEVDNHSEEELETSKGRVFRLWLTAAAAAALIGIIITVVPRKTDSPSFASELEQAELSYEDLEELELDESLYEELIIIDTLVPDTATIKKLPASVDGFKPSAGQSVITWEDISDEDIEEYLKDEPSINIIDEL